MAGSTHRGEEELVLSAYLKNNAKFPRLNLILAPRHPERFSEVADMLRAKGISFVRRSELGDYDSVREPFKEKVLLLDSVGELTSVYAIADIAVIGKSFIGTGGQNPLEPAYWGKPILCGPHMENFPFMQEFYDAGGTVIATKILAEKSAEPGKDAEVRKIMGKVFGLPDGGTMTAAFQRRIDEFKVHFINRNADHFAIENIYLFQQALAF